MTLSSLETRTVDEAPEHQLATALASPKRHRRPIRVVTHLTDGMMVEGFIHLPPLSRPLDLLNHSPAAFLAITDARMSNLEGQVRELPFVAVSKAQIVRMYEAEES